MASSAANFGLPLPHDPLTDPRPFAAVLSDWMARHGLTAYAAGPTLGVYEGAVRKWLKGGPCPVERSHRALMTLVDEGRVEARVAQGGGRTDT